MSAREPVRKPTTAGLVARAGKQKTGGKDGTALTYQLKEEEAERDRDGED